MRIVGHHFAVATADFIDFSSTTVKVRLRQLLLHPDDVLHMTVTAAAASAHTATSPPHQH